MTCQDVSWGFVMLRRFFVTWVVLLMSFGTIGAVILFGENVGYRQETPTQIALVGALDMGVQTGSISNSSHTLFVGLVYKPDTQILPADFNGDGIVNFSDFLLFAIGFGHHKLDPEYNAKLDLNHDTEIGFSDFLLFAAAFAG
jgi:hypothetical protein